MSALARYFNRALARPTYTATGRRTYRKRGARAGTWKRSGYQKKAAVKACRRLVRPKYKMKLGSVGNLGKLPVGFPVFVKLPKYKSVIYTRPDPAKPYKWTGTFSSKKGPTAAQAAIIKTDPSSVVLNTKGEIIDWRATAAGDVPMQ